jgi:hypothetical protein
VDRALIFGLFLPTAVTFAVGFAVVAAARRRPQTTAAVVGVAVAAGVAALWSAPRVVDAHGPEAGWKFLLAGAGLVVLGIPAWVLVVIARQPNGPTLGPLTVREWMGALAGYWLFCGFLTFLVAVVVHLAGTPSGQFR